MLIADTEKTVYTSNSNNKDWGLARLEKQKEYFVAAYNASGQVIPGSATLEYSWYKRKRKFADVRADLEMQGVDLSRTTLAVQQEQIWERFSGNYSFRDRMPARNIKEELTDYEYWIKHQDDAEFLQYLTDCNVDTHRTQDVVKQEKNYFDYINFIETARHLPKDQRRGERLDGITLKVSELDEEQRREDCLYRWQYNVLKGHIKCLPYCRIDIRKEIIRIVAYY
ncbi:MAG: hypothetical protein LBJ25_05020 [Candidatus Margulisbacteria bacterium]|nr:hypothetical protein [Candidatus Margulisiibacteriota bacterium]